MLKLPDYYEDVEDKAKKSALEDQVEKSAVLWVYEQDTKEANPLLHCLHHLWQGKTRQEVVSFATNTWDGDILPLRESLVRVAK